MHSGMHKAQLSTMSDQSGEAIAVIFKVAFFVIGMKVIATNLRKCGPL